MKFASWFDANYCSGHEKRFALALEWLEPRLTEGSIIYDFGNGIDLCPIDVAIRESFTCDLRFTGQSDLRYELDIPCEAANGVSAMEIIEHMRDRDEDPVDFFGYSGVRNLLSEAWRILKPGGWIFITTPNLSRYTCIWNVIRGESAAWVRAHVRELGWHELRRFVEEAGFRVERCEAVNVWEDLPYPEELAALADRLCPDVPRGDCIFLFARKEPKR